MVIAVTAKMDKGAADMDMEMMAEAELDRLQRQVGGAPPCRLNPIFTSV
jgi:hypothetical protein